MLSIFFRFIVCFLALVVDCTVISDQPEHFVLKGFCGIVAEKHLHLVSGVSDTAGHVVVLMDFYEKLPSASFEISKLYLRPSFVIIAEISYLFIGNTPAFCASQALFAQSLTNRRKTGVFAELFSKEFDLGLIDPCGDDLAQLVTVQQAAAIEKQLVFAALLKEVFQILMYVFGLFLRQVGECFVQSVLQFTEPIFICAVPVLFGGVMLGDPFPHHGSEKITVILIHTALLSLTAILTHNVSSVRPPYAGAQKAKQPSATDFTESITNGCFDVFQGETSHIC